MPLLYQHELATVSWLAYSLLGGGGRLLFKQLPMPQTRPIRRLGPVPVIPIALGASDAGIAGITGIAPNRHIHHWTSTTPPSTLFALVGARVDVERCR